MPHVAGGVNQLLPRMTALDRSRFDAHGLGLSFTPEHMTCFADSLSAVVVGALISMYSETRRNEWR